ncbi:MAG: hypothetical protein HY917_00905 [Candidatus Diapherotrites archaeon]|nr:hypothetical protein [Candidatus Diapherotrites archaeon]
MAIFFRAYLSDVERRLPGTTIRWESSSKGVVRYVPVTNGFEVMDTTTSTSYSESTIYPLTMDNRLFIVTRRSTDTALRELNPKTGDTLHSISFDSINFTVVNDLVFFRDRIQNDFRGDRSAGGAIMVQSLNGGSATELLAYGDPDNAGELYTAGQALVSVTRDFSDNTSNATITRSVRRHDLATGRVSQVLFEGLPDGTFISGSDALYQLVQDGRLFQVNRIPLNGPATAVLEVELEEGERGLSLDEVNGQLVLIAYDSDFKVKNVFFHSLATNETTEIPAQDFAGTRVQEFQALELP